MTITRGNYQHLPFIKVLCLQTSSHIINDPLVHLSASKVHAMITFDLVVDGLDITAHLSVAKNKIGSPYETRKKRTNKD